MRWQSLTIDGAEQAALPGYREPATIRHFEAPEALDTRFWEVRAKSALNRVPGTSRMPFRWTINPYRGCSHACTFCLDPRTQVLLADGRQRAIAEIEVGDRVVGTKRDGAYRRFTTTEVRDHWWTTKQAYRVVLADGTELIASGDHRFLTGGSWKFVVGAMNGPGQRPYLTIGSKLMGLDAPPAPMAHGRGYEPGVRQGPNAIGVATVPVRGGIVDQQRFLDLVDSAITRERGLDGRAIKTQARLEVIAIESVGMRELVDISTGSGDFIANGVVSHNCFARPTHSYLDFDAGRDFEKEIVVKVNAPEVLRSELARPSWTREHVAMGTNTDPYQWVESRYRLMPPILEALRDARTPCSILTKSPLLLRDLELLRTFEPAGVEVSAAFSVPTLEERAWRASEPHTPHPRKRLEAVGELNRAGIPTGILVAPLMPGINDDPRQVEEILAIAGEMGAVSIGGICLHLRGEVRGVFMDWLRSYRPDLVDRYEQLYSRGAYAPKDVRDELAAMVRRPWPAGRDWRARRRLRREQPPPAQPRPTVVQERLF